MLQNIFRLIIFLALSRITIQGNSVYRAAIVQYHPTYFPSDYWDIFDKNADNFVKFIDSTKNLNADIIIFPEFALASLIPYESKFAPYQAVKYHYQPVKPIKNKIGEYNEHYRQSLHSTSSLLNAKDLNVPCEQLLDLPTVNKLKVLSCAAKRNGVYLVASIYDRTSCGLDEQCASDHYKVHNTIVVFDREGNLTSVHRKYTSFYEPFIDKSRPQATTFTTDFGVTFVHFSDLEILDKKLVNYILKKTNATHVIHSTFHYDDMMPFAYTSHDLATWARENNMNVLSADGNGDSNIYMARYGPIRTKPTEFNYNLIMHADIPKVWDDCSRNCERTLPTISYLPFKMKLINCNDTVKANNSTLDPQVLRYCNGIDKKLELPGIEDRVPDSLLPIKRLDVIPKSNVKNFFTDGSFKSVILKPHFQWIHKRLCINDNFCCHFEIDAKFNNTIAEEKDTVYYSYRLIMGASIYLFSNLAPVSIKVCAVIACTSMKDENTCGLTFPKGKKIVNPMTFRSIIIVQNTIPKDRIYTAPIAYKSNETMLFGRDYSYVNPLFKTKPVLYLKEPTDDIHIFGLNTRQFNVDVHAASKHYKWIHNTYVFGSIALLVSLLVSIVSSAAKIIDSRLKKAKEQSFEDVDQSLDDQIDGQEEEEEEEPLLRKKAKIHVDSEDEEGAVGGAVEGAVGGAVGGAAGRVPISPEKIEKIEITTPTSVVTLSNDEEIDAFVNEYQESKYKREIPAWAKLLAEKKKHPPEPLNLFNLAKTPEYFGIRSAEEEMASFFQKEQKESKGKKAPEGEETELSSFSSSSRSYQPCPSTSQGTSHSDDYRKVKRLIAGEGAVGSSSDSDARKYELPKAQFAPLQEESTTTSDEDFRRLSKKKTPSPKKRLFKQPRISEECLSGEEAMYTSDVPTSGTQTSGTDKKRLLSSAASGTTTTASSTAEQTAPKEASPTKPGTSKKYGPSPPQVQSPKKLAKKPPQIRSPPTPRKN